MQGRASGNKELLRERELGSTFGKRQREHRLIIPESRSQASFLCTNTVTFPGSLQGVPTLLFLKLTRTGLVGLSALYVQTWGLLRLAPTSLGQSPSSCWCSAIPGFLLARGGGPEEWACRASSHLNGNAHLPSPPHRLSSARNL